MESPDELVTVALFESLGAATSARMFLESSGIPALVFEHDALRVDPFRPTESPRIRLAVRAEHAEIAREALAALPYDGEIPEPQE